MGDYFTANNENAAAPAPAAPAAAGGNGDAAMQDEIMVGQPELVDCAGINDIIVIGASIWPVLGVPLNRVGT